MVPAHISELRSLHRWPSTASPGVPYELTQDFLHELFTKHKIDYIIHGDDPCLLPDGTDAYAYAKKLGRFRMVSACMPLPDLTPPSIPSCMQETVGVLMVCGDGGACAWW